MYFGLRSLLRPTLITTGASWENATTTDGMIRGCIVKRRSGTLDPQGAGYYEVFVTVHQPVQYCIRHTHLQAWCSVLNREKASDEYTMILQHWLQSEIGLSLMSSVIETRALVRRTAKCYSKIDGRMNKKTKQAITYLIASTIQVILKNSAIKLINNISNWTGSTDVVIYKLIHDGVGSLL